MRSPEQSAKDKAEIIYRFFNTSDNGIGEISAATGIEKNFVSKTINEYLKPTKRKSEFLIIESKMNNLN